MTEALPATLVDRIRHRLVAEAAAPSPVGLAAALRAEGGLAAAADGVATLRDLDDELLGAGVLAPFLRDESVTDVLVNAPDEVWVDRGDGLARADVRFADDAAVRRLVTRLVAPSGRRFDASAPWVDARLPDGTRLHAVLPPVSVRHTVVSLRTFRRKAFDLDELVAMGSLDNAMGRVLRAVVDARLSVVVSGGTGSGKTTLLNTLLGLVAPAERIVTVEDAAELRPDRQHVVALEARPPNVEGAGEIRLVDLVRQALRMRPDRLVVGEVRGPEVVDMLAALNTGHEGGFSTVHANAAAEVPARIAALAAPTGLVGPALDSQLAAALAVVVHLSRDRAGVRRVVEIGLIERGAGAIAVVPAVARSGPSGTAGTCPGEAAPRLAELLASRGVPPPPPLPR